jgi:recombination protein RecA
VPVKIPPSLAAKALAIEPTSEPEKVKTDKQQKEEDKSHSLVHILKELRKDKGPNIIIKASQIPQVLRAPTGIFDLDFRIGGGFPFGRYSIIYGPESSCKTNIALRAVAQAQKIKDGPNTVVWVDVEQVFDPVWAVKMGVDVDALLVVKPGYGEEAADVIDALMRADDLAMLVVDSVAALISHKEIAKSLEEVDVMSSALLIKRLCNKIIVAFGEQSKRERYPCVLLINQVRFKPTQFGDPEVMPGGETQKFLASMRFRTSAKNKIDSATNQIISKEVHTIMKKAKVPVRAMDFRFDMYMTPSNGMSYGDTASFNAVKTYLQNLEFLVKDGKGYKIKDIYDVCKLCTTSDPKCPLCHGTGLVQKLYPSISVIEDQYYLEESFAVKLQQMINTAMTEVLVIDDPDYHNAPDESIEVPAPTGKGMLKPPSYKENAINAEYSVK